jgi:hypothetical protein
MMVVNVFLQVVVAVLAAARLAVHRYHVLSIADERWRALPQRDQPVARIPPNWTSVSVT